MAQTQTSQQRTRQQQRRTRVKAVGAAVATPLVVWAVARLVLGIEILSPEFGPDQPSEPVGAIHVAGAAAAASLAGWALLAVLERVTARARVIWTVVATGVLVLSLGAPFGGEGSTPASQYTLLAMHLAVGAVLIPGLRATTGSTATASAQQQEADRRQQVTA